MKRLTTLLFVCVLGGAGCSHSNNPPPESAQTVPVTPQEQESSYKPTNAGVPTTNDPSVPGHSEDDDATNAEPDNTDINKRDRDTLTLTPLDQDNDAADVKITAAIRQAIVGDDSLSFTAKNVKIITVDGVVTLRGPVNTPRERNVIASRARSAAGVTKVDNQLEVDKD